MMVQSAKFGENEKASNGMRLIGVLTTILGAIIIFAAISLNFERNIVRLGYVSVGFGWALLAYDLTKKRIITKNTNKEGE